MSFYNDALETSYIDHLLRLDNKNFVACILYILFLWLHSINSPLVVLTLLTHKLCVTLWIDMLDTNCCFRDRRCGTWQYNNTCKRKTIV